MISKDQIEKQLLMVDGNEWNLKNRDQKILISFLFVFNVFEAHLIKENETAASARKEISRRIVEKEWFNIQICDDFLLFFKDRYINNESRLNHKFGQLRLSGAVNRIETERGNAKSVLLDETDSAEKIMYCCLAISYRFRNNLFHGSKNILGLNLYYECFEVIIKFLKELMQQMLDNDFELLDINR